MFMVERLALNYKKKLFNTNSEITFIRIESIPKIQINELIWK